MDLYFFIILIYNFNNKNIPDKKSIKTPLIQSIMQTNHADKKTGYVSS